MTTFMTILFGCIDTAILGSALMTVLARDLIHAALWLIACFFSIDALYMLMQAEFAAVVQVMVYVGAISILILFAIMLTPDVSGETSGPVFARRWVGLLIAAALFGVLLLPTLYNGFSTLVPHNSSASGTSIISAREIGIAFMREHLLPFELASVLLFAALIGAIVIGLNNQSRRKILTLAEEIRMKREQVQVQDEMKSEF